MAAGMIDTYLFIFFFHISVARVGQFRAHFPQYFIMECRLRALFAEAGLEEVAQAIATKGIFRSEILILWIREMIDILKRLRELSLRDDDDDLIKRIGLVMDRI